MNKVIYLDYNATTPLDRGVYHSMIPFLKDAYGNASSKYSLGYKAKNAIKHARRNVADTINADENEIIFTSGASEANSTILKGIALNNPKKKHIITSSIEHPAILETCKYLEQYHGFRITRIPVSSHGVVDITEIKKEINPDTCLVTVMIVNNEVGSIQPVHEISKLCNENGIHFHCDAVQGIGKIDIDVKDIPFSSLAISAHKIYGPKGVGCLFLKDGIQIPSLINGGSQENGFRAGTENVPGIVGFGTAAKNAKENLDSFNRHTKELKELFVEELSKNLTEFKINGSLENTVPSTLNIQFSGIRGEALATALDQFGVCVSVASACSSSTSKLSHVLKAMGKLEDEVRSSIRLSFGKFTTQSDIIETVGLISKLVTQLRLISSKYSTYKKENVPIG